MKYLISIITGLVIATAAFSTSAQEVDNPFASLMGYDDVQYSYISPDMLKTLGSSVISGNTFQLESEQLTSVLVIKSLTDNLYKIIDKTVKKVVNDKKFKLLSSHRTSVKSYNIYGLPSKSGDSFDALIILEQLSGTITTLSYFTGNITLSQSINAINGFNN